MAEPATPLLPGIDFATAPLPDLHGVLASLRQAGPVVPVVYHGVSTRLITRHAELTAAFSDEDHFPSAAIYTQHSAPVMGRTLQCMGGDEHRVNRALVSPAFLPSRARGYVDELLVPLAHQLIDRFAGRGEVELIGAFARSYPMRIITRLLGIPSDDEPRLLEWALKLISYPWDPEAALLASAEFTRYLAPRVAERRTDPQEDLLSLLATEEVEGERLSDEEIYSFVRLLFPAGSDTSYKALGSLLYAVLTHDDVRQQLGEDASARAAVVEEGLRWEAPVALLPRLCAKETALGGVEIPADTPMLFGITAANRDPAVFSEPDRFLPGRRERSLAFGHGVHFCLGSHLARAELETALGVLLERLPGLRLLEPEQTSITGAVMRGPESLRVAF